MRGAIENRLTRAMASLCHYFEQRETLREEESGDLLRFALQAPRRMYGCGKQLASRARASKRSNIDS